MIIIIYISKVEAETYLLVAPECLDRVDYLWEDGPSARTRYRGLQQILRFPRDERPHS